MENKRAKTEDEEVYKTVKRSKKANKKKKKKHILLKIFIVLITIIAILAGVAAGYVYSLMSRIDIDDIDKNEIEINEGVETATGYRNILLLGVDSRENDYSGSLSDSIMIVSINQDTKKVKIASVYRDSYLKIGNSFDKITH